MEGNEGVKCLQWLNRQNRFGIWIGVSEKGRTPGALCVGMAPYAGQAELTRAADGERWR